jgi:hydroxymethylglutaryl-CoA synthase
MGIVGYGAYVPEWRIAAKEINSAWPTSMRVPGIQSKAVTDVDEDVITMAVMAAERAFSHAEVKAEEVEAIYLASTSAPCDDKSGAAIIQTVLGLSNQVVPVDITHSTRAGTIALKACLNQVQSGQISLGLVIAADNRVASGGDMLEYSQGAGAVALLIGKKGIIAEISGWFSATNEFTNVWRPYGETFLRRHDDNRVERELGYLRTVVNTGENLLNQLNLAGKDLNYLAAAEPDGKCLQAVAKSLGMAAESSTAANIAPGIGDTGTAAPFLGLASVLGQGNPGEKAVVISYGSGCGSDAFALEMKAPILEKRQRTISFEQVIAGGRNLSYPAYAKRVGIISVPMMLPDPISAFATQPSMLREAEYILGLTALKCKKCGSLNFPYRDYCIDCRGQEFTKVKLPRRGKLVTYNIQHVLPISPEEGPLVVGTIKLDGAQGVRGGKVSSAMISCDPALVSFGMTLELVFRRCGMEQGLPKYGYKFQPVAETTEGGRACG